MRRSQRNIILACIQEKLQDNERVSASVIAYLCNCMPRQVTYAAKRAGYKIKTVITRTGTTATYVTHTEEST